MSLLKLRKFVNSAENRSLVNFFVRDATSCTEISRVSGLPNNATLGSMNHAPTSSHRHIRSGESYELPVAQPSMYNCRTFVASLRTMFKLESCPLTSDTFLFLAVRIKPASWSCDSCGDLETTAGVAVALFVPLLFVPELEWLLMVAVPRHTGDQFSFRAHSHADPKALLLL